MELEILSLLVRISEIWFIVFLIKLAIKYWPKHNYEIKVFSGYTFKKYLNYGLFEAIFHVIEWVFRSGKLSVSDLKRISKTLHKAGLKKEKWLNSQQQSYSYEKGDSEGAMR